MHSPNHRQNYKITYSTLVFVYIILLDKSKKSHLDPVSLKHDGTDGTGIQSVSPVPSASAAGPSVPSVSNSRRKLTNWFANSRGQTVSGLFAPRTFRPMDTSPHGRTFHPIDVSPHGSFAPWTSRPLGVSPHGRFAPKTLRPHGRYVNITHWLRYRQDGTVALELKYRQDV